ncbi:MAG TPA: nuclear transport factor 2 family protein [Iamia sp.]|nr:nuclear transport factor 2 family protein [Iamia sp.]
MELWELVAREQIRTTLGAYTHAGDRGRADDMAALFTADGVLDAVGHEPAVGREAIAAQVRAWAEGHTGGPLRHHVSSIRITHLEPDRAEVHSYYLVLTADRADHWGRYRDEMVPDGDRWAFRRRTVTLDGQTPV